jgi:hypothetical protein
MVAELVEAVPLGGVVLDLGCGDGVPVARSLVRVSLTSRRVSAVPARHGAAPNAGTRSSRRVPRRLCRAAGSFLTRATLFDRVHSAFGTTV